MSVYDLLIDVAIASILILAGQLLRAKIPVFQKFFVPASMIAGFIGLAMGEQGLGILPFSTSIGSYAGVLIILVFTIVGVKGFKMGETKGAGEEVKRVLSFNMYRFVIFFLQFIIPDYSDAHCNQSCEPRGKSGHRNFAGIGLHGRTRHGGGLRGNLCRAWLAGSDRFGNDVCNHRNTDGDFWRPGFC